MSKNRKSIRRPLNRETAILVGPFVGSLFWEMYYFAPHMIYLYEHNLSTKFIIFTRGERFDLYGKYADILVRLNIPTDNQSQNFSCQGISTKSYLELAYNFQRKYGRRFKVKEAIYPDVESWRANIKWQFHRYEMNYSFRPRRKNKEIISKLFTKKRYIISDYKKTWVRCQMESGP